MVLLNSPWGGGKFYDVLRGRKQEIWGGEIPVKRVRFLQVHLKQMGKLRPERHYHSPILTVVAALPGLAFAGDPPHPALDPEVLVRRNTQSSAPCPSCEVSAQSSVFPGRPKQCLCAAHWSLTPDVLLEQLQSWAEKSTRKKWNRTKLEGQCGWRCNKGMTCSQEVSEAARRDSEDATLQVWARHSVSSLIQKFQGGDLSSCGLIPKIPPNCTADLQNRLLPLKLSSSPSLLSFNTV